MSEERKRILEMLQQGKINAEQAYALLEALEPAAPKPPSAPPPEAPSGPQPPTAPAMNWAEFGRSIAEHVRSQLGQVRAQLGQAFVTPGAPAGGAHRKNFSRVRFTRSYLSRMPDGTRFENYGRAFIADDVPKDLLEAKIGDYHNYGRTIGPSHLVAVLEDRCESNYGVFDETDEEQQAGGPADERPAVRPAPAPEPETRAGEVLLIDEEVGDWCRQVGIQCAAGRLEIVGSPQEASRRFRLLVRKRLAPDQPVPEGWEQEARAVPHRWERTGERLTCTLGTPGEPAATEGLAFRVEIPARAGVSATSAQGDVTARDIGGAVELTAESGAISCHDIGGDLTLLTGEGDVTVSDIGGKVQAETRAGNANVADVGGKAMVKAAGSVSASDIGGTLQATCEGGDASISDIGGKVIVETAGCAIAVHDIGGSVSANSQGGDISINDVAGQVTAHSAGGNIALSDIAGSATVDAGGGNVSTADVAGKVTLIRAEG